MTKTISLVLLFSLLVATSYADSYLPLGPNQEANNLGQQPPAANEGSENPCLMQPRGGMCLAYIPSWYYNASTGRCQDFIWGGCDGNANRFWTEDDCMKRCGGTITGSDSSENASSNAESAEVNASSNAESAEANASSNAESAEANASNSEPAHQESFKQSTPTSEEAGSQETGNSDESGRQETGNSEESKESAPEMCKQPAVPGKCRAFLPRFYFNDENGKCESFIYGGCEGNLNNFKSEEECEKSCHYPRQEK